jgi:hypothetical protein
MRSFLESLTRVSKTFRADSDSIRNGHVSLQDQYYGLQDGVRQTLVPKPIKLTEPRPYSHPPHVPRRAHSRLSTPIQSVTSNVLDPYRNHSFPPEPIRAAPRIYRSPATQKLYSDVLDGYQDYLQHPTRHGILDYESQIDPFLHVGAFPEDELSGTVIGGLTRSSPSGDCRFAITFILSSFLLKPQFCWLCFRMQNRSTVKMSFNRKDPRRAAMRRIRRRGGSQSDRFRAILVL